MLVDYGREPQCHPPVISGPPDKEKNGTAQRPFLPAIIKPNSCRLDTRTTCSRSANPYRSQTWEQQNTLFQSLQFKPNSPPEPPPRRLYSAKISRALWLGRFFGLTLLRRKSVRSGPLSTVPSSRFPVWMSQ